MDLKNRIRLGCSGFIGAGILWNFGEIGLSLMNHDWLKSLAILIHNLVMMTTLHFLNETKAFDFVMVNEEDWNLFFNTETEAEDTGDTHLIDVGC